MAILTQQRNHVRIYHDVDTDRAALHERFSQWEDSEQARDIIGRSTVDSFTYTGVPGVEGGEIHTIVVTFISIDPRIAEQRQRADTAESQVRILRGAAIRARDALDTALGGE